MYDLLLKDGLLIDPSQSIHAKRDVAVVDGLVAAVEPEINPQEAAEVIPLSGKMVTPGLIDAHCHAGWGIADMCQYTPDELGVNMGVTCLNDAGTPGAFTFGMGRNLAEVSQTDLFFFLNIAATGLVKVPEILIQQNMEEAHTREVVEANRDIIKGIKVRIVESLLKEVGIKAVETAKRVASDLGLPVMMHLGEPRPRVANDPLDALAREAVNLLDKGDVLSHFLTWEPAGMINPGNGEVYPELLEARKRGVYLDCCHGLNHFSFKAARIAFERDIYPDIISTDMNSAAVKVVQSLPVLMSKLLALGLSLEQVIAMTTVNPAAALGESGNRGSLKVGMPADITVLELVSGEYLFSDGTGRGSLKGDKLLEPRLVIKAGEQMPVYSRYQVPPIYTSLVKHS